MDLKSTAVQTLLTGMLAQGGERGQALAALFKELSGSIARLEYTLIDESSDSGMPTEFILGLTVDGQPVTVKLLMDRGQFDRLWSTCNLKAIFPAVRR